MKFILSILLFFISFGTTYAQDNGTDAQLAQHYYSKGEYSKALGYYERLYSRNQSKYNFTRYLDCLQETGQVKQAEKLLKRQVNRDRSNQEYSIMLASFYEDQLETDKATKIYNGLIDNMRPNARNIVQLYNLFKGQGKNDQAFAVLEKGRKTLKNNYPLNYQFADYYGSIGETEKMIDEYLDLIDYHPSYRKDLQRVLSRQIDFSKEESEEYDLLKKALITRSQKNPNDTGYSEMLTWLFIQRQNFGAAFVHSKAIDKRTTNDGKNVYNLGGMCIENNDFSTAKKCFRYVMEKGEKSPYFYRAQNALLNVSFREVTTLRNFSNEEVNQTISEYTSALERVGTSRRTLPMILELAHIEAFYGNKANSAIERLNNAKSLSGLTDIQRAETKMQLADIHVLHGDIWEAALLYGQIDTDFKYEPIGHEAKFKNARIFYYDGEFDYAQSQLDVLKQSTSKLIANDALKLSLLITDNFGLDSNYTAMNWFASADLLIEQHQYEAAFALFDSISLKFPAHSLGDEILLKEAHALQLRGQWTSATKTLEELLEFYGQDILADDALFQLGDIYENRLFNKEKAIEFYRRILFDYKGSLYSAEARKRFQQLRKELPSSEGLQLNE